MSKMTVIQLLNKIANGEEDDLTTEFEFQSEVYNFFKFKNDSGYCLDRWLLNQDIVITKHKEVIEDKKIEKMIPLNNVSGASDLVALSTMQWENNLKIERKINEIIDYLEENKND